MLKNIRDYIFIKISGLFDKEFYKLSYPEVLVSKIDPLWHFVTKGWKEGKNPSEIFNTNYYLEENPDVKQGVVNPVFHYILFGKKEGRLPSSQAEVLRISQKRVNIKEKTFDILRKVRNLLFPTSTPLRVMLDKVMGKYYIQGIPYSVNKHDYEDFIDRSLQNEELIQKLIPLQATELVDIVICVGPNDKNIRQCLNSIVKFSKKGSYNLNLVVHKKDVANIRDLITPEMKVYTHEMELFNYARANNLALRQCTNDVILLNDDTEVTEGWIEELRHDSKGVALTGAHTGKQCAGNPQMWGEGPTIMTSYPINMFCAYLPKRLREVVGLLDEEFAYYGGEDTDYSCRALQNGFPLIISSTFVVHKDNQSFKESKEFLIKETFKLLYEKYKITPPFDLRSIKPLVSIIIATHNRQDLLSNAISSIENNNYNNYELIIVDDCSSDNTSQKIIDLQAKNKKIKFIRMAENVGSVMARQIGIKASSGQFLLFSDDDDTILQNRISAPLSCLLTNPLLDVVYCNYNVIGNNGEITPVYCKPFDKEAYLRLDFNIGAGILLGRRDVFTNVPFMTIYERAVDYDWVFRLLRKGYKIDLCPEIVMNYNRTGSSTIHLSGNMDSISEHKSIRQREELLNELSKQKERK